MIKFINNFLNARKQRKLANKIADLQEQAMIYQRNGNLRALAFVTEQITELEKQIDE
jgi:cell fate (sporulation/competence/biofilm development) regulator YmcA (YheA/YmcA/DUF963 family)